MVSKEGAQALAEQGIDMQSLVKLTVAEMVPQFDTLKASLGTIDGGLKGITADVSGVKGDLVNFRNELRTEIKNVQGSLDTFKAEIGKTLDALKVDFANQAKTLDAVKSIAEKAGLSAEATAKTVSEVKALHDGWSWRNIGAGCGIASFAWLVVGTIAAAIMGSGTERPQLTQERSGNLA